MVRALGFCVLAVFLVLTMPGLPAWADAGPANAIIQARFQPDGDLLVDYRFDRPVEKISFAYGVASFRRARWHVVDQTASWTRAGDLVSRKGPLDHLRLRIQPGWDRADRTFADLIPMGQGAGMFYPGWLLPRETAVAVEVRLEAAPARSLLDRTRQWSPVLSWSAREIEERALYAWLYTGPEQPIHPDGLTLVASSDLPAGQVATVREAAQAALTRYRELLNRPPSDPPLIFLAGREDGHTATSGSVGPGGIISMILRLGPDGLPADRVGRTVWHETFHLWNRHTRPGSHPWLHEGAAEVAALLRHGDDPAGLRDALAAALSDCVALLPPGEGVSGPTARHGHNPYRCGLAANLIIAAGLAPDGDWVAGFGRLWRPLLALSGGQGPEDARALAGEQAPGTLPALQRLLDGGGIWRTCRSCWRRLAFVW